MTDDVNDIPVTRHKWETIGGCDCVGWLIHAGQLPVKAIDRFSFCPFCGTDLIEGTNRN